MKKPSFKFILLSTVVTGYILLCIGFSLAFVTYFRQDIAELSESRKRWLELYANAFLSDLQTGNTKAIERKLRLLTQREAFERVELVIGDKTIWYEAPSLHNETSYWFQLGEWLIGEQEISVPVRDGANSLWAVLRASLKPEIILNPIQDRMIPFLKWAIVVTFASLGLLLVFVDRQSQKLALLIDYVSSFGNRNYRPENVQTLLSKNLDLGVDEWVELCSQFKNAIRNFLAVQNRLSKQETEAELGRIAAQVAHDIRSPLTALMVVSKHSEELPEESRQLVKTAVQRIQDIASDLLNRYQLSSSKLEEPTVEPLLPVIESVLSEKRAQYRSRPEIIISLETSDSTIGTCARIQSRVFKRILSNILNNAVEAIANKGTVTLSIKLKENNTLVVVEDTGKGIEKHLIPKILEGGMSHNKLDGHGLGLAGAREVLRSWNGDLEIRSHVNRGTKVGIVLPGESPPDWFATRLPLTINHTVYIVDDDSLIHEVWKKRFEESQRLSNVTLKHFHSPEALQESIELNGFPVQSFFLVDYEFKNSAQNGLDLIKNLKLIKCSVLVTNRFEDEDLRSKVIELGLQCIPKTLAPYIKLEWR